MSTAKSKQAIVDWCAANPTWLRDMYEEPLSPEEEQEITEVQDICKDGKNWSRLSKEVDDDYIMRYFVIKDAVMAKHSHLNMLADARATVEEMSDGTFEVEVCTD